MFIIFGVFTFINVEIPVKCGEHFRDSKSETGTDCVTAGEVKLRKRVMQIQRVD